MIRIKKFIKKVAVLMLNLDRTGKRDIYLDLKEVGLNGEVNARDVINHKDIGSYSQSITVSAETNQCRFLVLSKE